jgi:hypothetical protein
LLCSATLVFRLRNYLVSTIYRTHCSRILFCFHADCGGMETEFGGTPNPGKGLCHLHSSFEIAERDGTTIPRSRFWGNGANMSQQEFEMGPQANQQNSSNEEDEIHQPQYPYSWSGKINREGVPRDEPPSNYDATILQQAYQAQTPNTSNVPGPQQPQVSSQHSYITPGSDGDAYEQGYRPYTAYNGAQSGQQQGVPPWARPQTHPRNPVRFATIILVLLGVGLCSAIFGSLGSGLGIIGSIGGAIILAILFIILVPLLILFVILAVLFRMFRPRRARNRYWRRGPW